MFSIVFVFMVPTAVLLLYILLRLLIHQKQLKRWVFPPGPCGLPIVGSFFPLITSSSPHVKLSEWANIYGGVYTVTILTKKVLVVSCPKLMRKFFEHPASAGKFDMEPILLLSGGPYGVTSTQGHVWLEQRKFCVRTLRQFGMGKRNEIQSKILSEAEQAVQWIRKEAQTNNGFIESPINLLRTVTSNTLWKIVRGNKFPLDDRKVKSITGDFADAINTSVKTGLAIFPWLKWLAPKRFGYTDLLRSSKRLRRFIAEQFEEHRRHRHSVNAGKEKGEPCDMIDAYIDQMEMANVKGKSKSSFYGLAGRKHSIAIVAEMFAGGGESTPHTLNWLLLYLIHHQDIQSKLHQEIDQVLGTQEPCLQDKSRMPYAEAVLLETLRKCPVFPLTTAHKLTEDIDSLCGFKLPKETLLISNIFQAHMNKQFWGDPEIFRPERFHPGNPDEEKIVAERKASVIVFNVGKRVCLGEPLATDILFLFVVKLFQVFRMLPFPENGKPDFESSEPFLMMAKPFSIVVKERKRV